MRGNRLHCAITYAGGGSANKLHCRAQNGGHEIPRLPDYEETENKEQSFDLKWRVFFVVHIDVIFHFILLNIAQNIDNCC